MKLILIFILSLAQAFADVDDASHRPKSFPHQGGMAVFVDFKEAHYDITYNYTEKKAEVVSRIKFKVVEPGYPIFDSVAAPSMIKINGIIVASAPVNTPNFETQVRIINRVLNVGLYEFEITTPLKNLVEFYPEGIKSAFWVSDLDDRAYLERYLPVNFEFDRVKMIFNINFVGNKVKQHIFTNGEVTWDGSNKARIVFPEKYTVNSVYFHTTPVGTVDLLETSFTSRNGRNIPVSIYMAPAPDAANELEELKTIAQENFEELEMDYGAFPHDTLTIYNADLSSWGLGGMEYAGATVTNKKSLSHELFHSYFGRAVTPANGNAGWIDEALASWRDFGYYRSSGIFGTSAMAAHPPYTRKTDTAAYSFGHRFMAFLDYKVSLRGGLKPFLRKLVEKRSFVPLFTEEFITEMETYYSAPLNDVFRSHVYGPVNFKSFDGSHSGHRKLSQAELESIL